MKYLIAFAFLFVLITNNSAQEDMDITEDYYYKIPDFPVEYNEFTVLARMVDGFGFRYYWATKDLREEDLEHRPSEDARTSGETLEHIYGLSRTVRNAALNEVNVRDDIEMTFAERRKATLENIKIASETLKAYSGQDMNDLHIIFQRNDQTAEYPIWNLLNGPLADAIYHVGQIVSFRRSSGNPIDSGISMFRGSVRN